MKSFTKLSRTATITGVVLAVSLVATVAMPAQAAYVAEKTVSTAHTAVMHLCQRFCWVALQEFQRHGRYCFHSCLRLFYGG